MNAGQILQSVFMTDPSRGAAPEPPEPTEVLPLADMLHHLAQFADGRWGHYAVSRDPLAGRLPADEWTAYIERAMACGRGLAVRLVEQEGKKSPAAYATGLGVRVSRPLHPTDGSQVLFAQFKPPSDIFLYADCLQKASPLFDCGAGIYFSDAEELADILLAHELFHVFEEREKTSIYTQRARLPLWKLGPFQASSPVSCLGEIAAMAFAKELCALRVSPFLLDVLLVYGYNPAAATRLYHGIIDSPCPQDAND